MFILLLYNTKGMFKIDWKLNENDIHLLMKERSSFGLNYN